jgi:hypothetical protein
MFDMELAMTNAIQHNPPKHPVHLVATILWGVFEREWVVLGARCIRGRRAVATTGR